jgi:hypothetical protein
VAQRTSSVQPTCTPRVRSLRQIGAERSRRSRQPKQTKPTLGYVVQHLRTQGHLWKLGLPGPNADYSVEPLVSMLDLFWPNPDRHGNPQQRCTPSIEEGCPHVDPDLDLSRRSGYEFLQLGVAHLLDGLLSGTINAFPPRSKGWGPVAAAFGSDRAGDPGEEVEHVREPITEVGCVVAVARSSSMRPSRASASLDPGRFTGPLCRRGRLAQTGGRSAPRCDDRAMDTRRIRS